MARKISEVQSQLNELLTGIRWVSLENLHFTLKFLGDVEEKKIGPIADGLFQALRFTSPFRVTGRGIGVFPDIRRARVLWVGLAGRGLESLAQEVDSAVEPYGFSREKRAFMPHLTIGRWRKYGGRSEGLEQELERRKDQDFGESRVQEVVFLQSLLNPQGAVYSPLQVIRLTEQPTPS
jgi:2'-5' RNA ligase